jgi:hypothetical protein
MRIFSNQLQICGFCLKKARLKGLKSVLECTEDLNKIALQRNSMINRLFTQNSVVQLPK